MDSDARDGIKLPDSLADPLVGEERTRLAARAYRPSKVELDDALRHGWLEVWYQPKVDLRRNGMVGAEALARIRHPELGILLPKSFLPTIPDASIAHLTEHVVRAALRDWSSLDTAGANLRLSINVPLGTLQQVPIAALVADHRPAAEHWPGLIVEVTEDQIVRDLDLAQRLASGLRGSGISISIDDFGAGHSALARLRELPFAELKVDNGFVKDCAVDAANAAICQLAVDVAHRLGVAVVAKGIETSADLHALQVMGCDLGQGVLLAPPLPLPGLLDLVQRRQGRPTLSEPGVHPAQARRPGIDRVA